jgi:hypothetical protein
MVGFLNIGLKILIMKLSLCNLLRLPVVFVKCTRRQAILTEAFLDFSQSLQVNAGILH